MDINVKTSNIYNMMLQRCYNPKFTGYDNYGGRGIFVSQEWIDNPTAFFDWYKANYFEDGQVDRLDNEGPYSEDNCKVVTRKENNRNRRTTVNIEAFGESKNAAAWVEDPRCHVKDWRNLFNRVVRRGVDAELAMSAEYNADRYARAAKSNRQAAPQIEAFGESKCLADWVDDERCVVEKRTLWARISNEWELERAITTPARKWTRKS